MRVVIRSSYSGAEYEFRGNPSAVYSEILEKFPWLHSGDAEHHNDVESLVEQIDASQALEAEIVPEDKNLIKAEGNLEDEDLDNANEIVLDMLGFNPEAHPAFAAARFLAGGNKTVTLPEIRQALYDQDGDFEAAALQVYHLPDTDENKRALQAVLGVGNFAKAEPQAKPPQGKDVEPGVPEAMQAAEEVRRAFAEKQVRVAHLGGKHSKGSLLAKDGETHDIFLLKPGSGGQSPAAGAAEEPATQSRREAAFWHVADMLGLGECIPKADLVIIDGTEFAAIRMLPFSYQNFQKKLLNEPALGRRALAPYRDSGILTKWAVIDYVLGNPDRHGQNLMVSADDKVVALIDHGSAFAADDFDPAYDRNSFVPYYLRAWAPTKFNRLPLADKLKMMPTVADPVRQQLMEWVNGIHADRLQAVLHRYGIDPKPTLERLAKLKVMTTSMPVDVAINRLWVTT